MSNQKALNPFSIWQDYYKNVENYWGQAVDEKMKTEEFSEWMGKILDINLLYKGMSDKSAKQYLDQMNLPSREELSNLSSLIVNLDTKVDDMEEKLEENLENQASSTNIKKEILSLKKEVKELDSKLDEVLQFLKEDKKGTTKNNGKNNSTTTEKNN